MNMKSICTAVLILVTALFFGCKHAPSASKASGTDLKVTFVVSCSEPSVGFVGTIICDGRTNHVSGKGGGTFLAAGHDIVGSFTKSGAAGKMTVNASDSAGNSNTATTDKASGTVLSEFHGQPVYRHGASAL